ncbi:D-arabinono-1,4-lactone oxidase [Thermopolyspora sp. NPDC052614]|uniref:D-arabinono-1,4-lactone oxidase n=1 Tax=Thermopolyspora sp. NPDC052614 TaxID=3155682 RepID=UPI003420878B
MSEVFRNWAGNQVATPIEVRTPSCTREVAAAVAEAAETGRRVRMAGSGHSFTGVALTEGLLLRPHALTGVREAGDGRVRVAAGTPLHVLNEELHRRGLALANMGDITAQTVAGAIQTGTHGSGRDVGGLADQVAALELVLADGSVVEVGEDDPDPERRDLFDAARVGLGALGVVTEVTLKVVPAFRLRSERRPMRFGEVLETLEELTTRNEHVDFFWFPHTDFCMVKLHNRDDGPVTGSGGFKRWFDNVFLENTVFGAVCEVGTLFPRTIPAINRLSGRALTAAAYTDVSHRVFATVRRVRFLEMEYAIPAERLPQALREVRDLIDRGDWNIVFPVEVRVSPPSDAWLSTAYGRATAYLAFHVYRRMPLPAYFEAAEQIMVRLDGRPHWGKLHTRDAAYLATAYPRFGDFAALRARLDPRRLFGNDHLDAVLG